MRNMRAKLIFNPNAGAARASSIQLTDVIHELQAWKLVSEVFLIEADCDLPGAIKDALSQGIRMFVVCGGDGTISAVAGMLAGSRATLGIIPSGTQNNTALSLGIPEDIPAAISILRTGRRIKVDIGVATSRRPDGGGGEISTPFLELCSVGLISALFPSTDDVQHGNLARVGDFVTALVSSPPAEMHLVLDGKQEVRALGHVVLVSNMPYFGRHYKIGPDNAYHDGMLDVLFFADLSKLDLVDFVLRGADIDNLEDPRIQHYRVRRIEIDTQPAMPIMVDGNPLQDGWVRVEVRRRVLTVMAGAPTSAALPDPSAINKAKTDATTE
ncbi:MAG: diacylglycerol kinase family protein [Caldilinea sp.]